MRILSTDFYKEWDKAHTSQPSPQDIIDWTVEEITKRLANGKSNLSLRNDGSC